MNDDLLSRHFAGETTPAEEQELQSWLRADPEHRRSYAEIAALLQGAEAVDRGWLDAAAPAAADLVRLAEERATDFDPAQMGSRRRLWGLAAAAAVVAIGVGVTAYARWVGSKSFGVNEFVTGAGETVTVSLKDGSVVRLAAKSRLRILGGPDAREVELAGRGFFAVAKQAGREFRIRTASGQVTVLGTRFDLQADAEQLEVTVVEGTVRVEAAKGETRVTGGQLGRVLRGVPIPPAPVRDPSSTLAWTGAFLAFQETPVAEAAREIERKLGVRIVIEDPRLAERTVTAWFSESTAAEVLEVVCAATDAVCTASDGVVTMRLR
jgi:transmembrane sensor